MPMKKLQASHHGQFKQYFVVTPNLLPDLPMGENMRVHITFKGRNLKYTRAIDLC